MRTTASPVASKTVARRTKRKVFIESSSHSVVGTWGEKRALGWITVQSEITAILDQGREMTNMLWMPKKSERPELPSFKVECCVCAHLLKKDEADLYVLY